MNRLSQTCRAGTCALALMLLILAGCASQKIDWGARVGSYTYDQAVLDFGPPDKFARLSDGGTVAEWLTHRGRSYAYSTYGYGYSPWFYGPYYPGYVESSSPDYFLRLSFTPDGRLTAWKNFYK